MQRAGGANVWSYALLRRLLPPAFAPLPRGADLRVAVRRTLRSGKNAGGILEDLGVRPDQRHWMTRADLLHDNRDLMAAAGKLLAGRPAYPLRLEGERRTRTRFSATLTFANLTRLDLYLDDRPIRTLDVTGTSAPLDLARAPGATLHVRGFVGDAGGDRLVAALRRTIG